MDEQQPQNEVNEEQQEINQAEPTPLSPPPSHKKLIIGIVVVFVLVVAGIAVAYFVFLPKIDKGPIACTADAKICPDGSGVGRTGPNCEFAECPVVELLESKYGINITIPTGWYVWEGQSAMAELAWKEGFYNIKDTSQSSSKLLEYQKFMDTWNVENSRFIHLTNADIDYKNRDFEEAVNIFFLTSFDNEDLLKEVTLDISLDEFNLEVKKNNERREDKKVNINGVEALLVRLKGASEHLDNVSISVPLIYSTSVNNKNAKGLTISRWVKKDDLEAEKNLIEFISKLNI